MAKSAVARGREERQEVDKSCEDGEAEAGQWTRTQSDWSGVESPSIAGKGSKEGKDVIFGSVRQFVRPFVRRGANGERCA